MKKFKYMSMLLLLPIFMVNLTACSPEVGSDEWCAEMKKTPTGDWSTNQATDYAKNCLLK